MTKTVKTIRARYLGKDTGTYRHFHIYDLFTWIEAGYIVISSNCAANLGYSDVVGFSKDWQVVYGGNENADARPEAQINNNSTRTPESAGV